MDSDDDAKEPLTTVADLAATAALPPLPPLRTATLPYHPGDIILGVRSMDRDSYLRAKTVY